MSDPADSGITEPQTSEDEAAESPSKPVKVEGEKSEKKAAISSSPAIEMEVFGCTDVGQVRDHNEDNFLIADLSVNERLSNKTETQSMKLGDGGVLLAVCDGMGGAAAGEVASQLATDIVYQRMAGSAGHRDRDRLGVDIVEALEEAGQKILVESNSNRACRGMGTTATVAALVDDYLLLGQVGDSRAYIMRDDRLVQVTRDQSLVRQLIDSGQLTEEEAEHFEHSNIILQALGTADVVQVDLTYVRLCRGDILLMCSDGLSGMIRDYEISDGLVRHSDPATACRALIEDANQAGGHDNVTVIIAAFKGSGLQAATADDVDKLHYQKYRLPPGIDARCGRAFPLPILKDFNAYDDTPYIEITGEFEVDPNVDWADMFDNSPHIPKEEGPNWSTMAIWLAVITLLVAGYIIFLG